MTTCKQYIVQLVDELLRLFSEPISNKIVYSRLVTLRHVIRNTLSEDDVLQSCKEFYVKNKEMFVNNDMKMFSDSPYATIIEFVWNELGPQNKERVRQWVDCIIQNFVA